MNSAQTTITYLVKITSTSQVKLDYISKTSALVETKKPTVRPRKFEKPG
jgi:hypothetical protein